MLDNQSYSFQIKNSHQLLKWYIDCFYCINCQIKLDSLSDSEKLGMEFDSLVIF